MTTGTQTKSRGRGEASLLNDYCAQLGTLLERRHTERALIAAKEQAERAAALAEESMRQALEADRAKTKFLANMTHELRTPLNAIIGFSELIQNSPKQADEHSAYASYIHDSGTHLLGILNGVLDLARIEAGRLVLEQHEVSIAELVEAAVGTHGAAAARKSIGIAARTPVEHSAWLDPGKLKRVLDNLLSNAIKFTPEGGTIEIASTIAAAGQLVVAVCDTGCGIPADYLDRVLEPFGQVEDHLTRENDGVGLGLPIAKALVALHGGSLRLISEVEVGTTAEVWLPADRVRLAGNSVSSLGAENHGSR
ncbi:MAG TPA: HAMP domain-containing sensor histidine kinase [Stellaceae bacterium]|nr:HAMP domain-containing sensor histidine kinase [Stellaceae bacterium]